MASYAVPAGDGRWSTGPAALLAAGTLAPRRRRRRRRARAAAPGAPRPAAGRGRAQPAQPNPAGDGGGDDGEGLRRDTTVADIVAAAGVAKEAFYRHFADKEQAFLEAQEHPSRQILDALVTPTSRPMSGTSGSGGACAGCSS